MLLQLDHVAVRVLGIDREAFAACATASDRLVVQEGHAELAETRDSRLQRAVDSDAEVEEASGGGRLVGRVGHEIEELVTHPQGDERPRSLPVLGFVLRREAEHVAVETQRRLQITDAEDEVIEAADTDHGPMMRRKRLEAQASQFPEERAAEGQIRRCQGANSTARGCP